jgi:hypothetical protein
LCERKRGYKVPNTRSYNFRHMYILTRRQNPLSTFLLRFYHLLIREIDEEQSRQSTISTTVREWQFCQVEFEDAVTTWQVSSLHFSGARADRYQAPQCLAWRRLPPPTSKDASCQTTLTTTLGNGSMYQVKQQVVLDPLASQFSDFEEAPGWMGSTALWANTRGCSSRSHCFVFLYRYRLAA